MSVADNNYRTRFAAYLNGVFLPLWAGEVELTSYGTSDSCSVTTYLQDQDDLGAISQSGKYLPLTIKVGTIGGKGLNTQLLAAYLEEIDTDYKNEEIVVHGRGLLAPLVDKRITAKVYQTQDIAHVIQQLLSTIPGLKYVVNNGQTAGITAGKVMTSDYVSLSRNMRVTDYINQLGNALGWRMRVVGATVIVGPPAGDNAPKLQKRWGGPTGGLDLRIKHNALHAHNIHVRVVSYLRHQKQGVKGKAGPKTLYQAITNTSIVVPAGSSPSKAKAKAPYQKTGNVAGVASGSIPDVGEQEEYTIPIKGGKNQDQCNAIAAQLQAEISRHEFIAELEWIPTSDEISFLCANGVEWLLQLSGCSQQSHNGTYHPKRINFTFSEAGGLSVKVLAVNHLLPAGADSDA